MDTFYQARESRDWEQTCFSPPALKTQRTRKSFKNESITFTPQAHSTSADFQRPLIIFFFTNRKTETQHFLLPQLKSLWRQQIYILFSKHPHFNEG